MSVEDLDLPAGSQIAGRYVIERGVRRGAHLAVYTARADASAARFTVRVARLPSPGDEAEASVARELQRVAMLRQRAVSGLMAVVREGDDLAVITERPDGPTLRELLQKSGQLRSADICRLFTEVAAVLDALHSAVPPIVHRALMPENIAVGERMLRVWVDECGLAQALTDAGLLPAEASIAPVAYRSPGELAGRATPADDMFVLASLAYECITGRPAHEGGSDEESAALILRGPRPSVRAVRASGSVEVDAVLQRAWSDEARYPTAGAFTRELVRVLTANPSSRGIPAATAKARPESVELRGGGDGRQATLLGVVPGSHGDSAASGNPMKSTLLGLGGPRSSSRGARAGGPFGPPIPPAPSPAEGAEAPADKARGRRLSETTQRVEVPRIRPPGTEPVDASSGRQRATTPFGGRPFPRPVGPEMVRPVSSVPPPPPSMLPAPPSVAPMLPEPVEPHDPSEDRTLPPARPAAPRDSRLSITPSHERVILEPSIPPAERLSDSNWDDIEASLDVSFDDASEAPTKRPALTAEIDPEAPTARPVPITSPPVSIVAPPLAVTALAPVALAPASLAPTSPSAPSISIVPAPLSIEAPAPSLTPPEPPRERPSVRPIEGFGVVTADAFDIVSDDDFATAIPSVRPDAAANNPPPLPSIAPQPPLPLIPEVPLAVAPISALASAPPPPLPPSFPRLTPELPLELQATLISDLPRPLAEDAQHAAPPSQPSVAPAPQAPSVSPPPAVPSAAPPPAVPSVAPTPAAPSVAPPMAPPIVFTPPPEVSHEAPVLRPSIPLWAPPPAPPVAPAAAVIASRTFRVVVVLSVSLVVAAGVLTAGWLYGRKLDRPETDTNVTVTRRPHLPPPVDPRVPPRRGHCSRGSVGRRRARDRRRRGRPRRRCGARARRCRGPGDRHPCRSPRRVGARRGRGRGYRRRRGGAHRRRRGGASALARGSSPSAPALVRDGRARGANHARDSGVHLRPASSPRARRGGLRGRHGPPHRRTRVGPLRRAPGGSVHRERDPRAPRRALLRQRI